MSRLTTTRSRPTITGENSRIFYKGKDQSMCEAGGLDTEFASCISEDPYGSTAQNPIGPAVVREASQDFAAPSSLRKEFARVATLLRLPIADVRFRPL